MGRRVRILSALVAGTLAFVVGTPTAHAILSKDQYKCQAAISKEATSYVTKKLKIIQKCKDAELAVPGTCPTPDALALQALADKLDAGLAKKCAFDKLGPGFDDDNLSQMGFPGPCTDTNPGDGFTLLDLQDCILASHDNIFTGVCRGGTNLGEVCAVVGDCPDSGPGTACDGYLRTQYDPDVGGPIANTKLKCQREVAKNAAKFVGTLLKSVQKCRNGLLNCKTVDAGEGVTLTVCKVTGVAPQLCKLSDAKTKKAVDKARDKAIAAITSKCENPTDVVDLELCEPNQTTAADAAACIIQIHEDLTDNENPADASDLIDYQYAQRGICGDGRLNQASEECDGAADLSCPGQCGTALGFFPCLCQTIPRTRVVEHSNADLDNGYTGLSHDSGIVEGGGYVTELWECDGPLGPDFECLVGPHCALPPHQPCNVPRDTISGPNQDAQADFYCPGPGNFCRKTASGATGPHCEIQFNKRCKTDAHCSTIPGDRCIIHPHGAPLPLSSGGVSVCLVNEFTEDVTGTTNLQTGEGSIRLRQNSSTYAGGAIPQPCPVCGGFCAAPAGQTDPQGRSLCSNDSQCPGSFCVLDPICSYGANIDGPCRPDPPFGGPTEFFGNPSVDCPVGGGASLFGTLDILFNPASTSVVTKTANESCGSTPGFGGKTCAGGINQHRECTVDSECPGGTCNFQCFCPTPSGLTQRPNSCFPACLGGALDGDTCATNADCLPPGFCHPADCRLNVSDTDSAQEGQCTAGPFDDFCTLQSWKPCESDADCQPPPAGNCLFCDPSETCDAKPRDCFVNPTIIREGAPGIPSRVTAALFCIPQTANSPAVNTTAGLPGQGAITQPSDSVEVGF